MPGIAGLITKMPREWAESQLQRMVRVLRHEAFYLTGTWIDESLGIYAGWSEPEGAFSEGMPLRNERGDIVLVFSGEDFPEPGVVSRLKAQGHSLDSRPSSYLVHLFEDDPRFPATLNGRFHGLLADQRQATATLFNDRYGLQRIYYHEAKEAFYFAGEAKAILAARPELRRLDARGLSEFLACGCVLENRALFKTIHALPPASAWTFRDGKLETKRAYFEPGEWEEQERLEPDAWYRELREVFARNLPRYFNGGQRIGVSLTGGLDTRMITAWHKPSPGSLPCYTFGGSFRECQDVLSARRTAKVWGQPHQVIPVGDEFLSNFPRYAERAVYLTDGCVEVNRAPALYANEKAREIAPVRMTGNYGSQVLRAARPSAPRSPLPAVFSAELIPNFREAQTRYIELCRIHPVSFAVFRQVPWLHHGIFALEQTQLSQRSPFLDNDLVRTVFRAPASVLANSNACLRLIADGSPDLFRVRTDRGIAGNQGPLVAGISRGFLESTFKAEYAYDYGMPQWLARADHFFSSWRLERLFLGRHKFYHFRVWYRDALSKYVREILLDGRTLSRPFFERKALEAIVRSHTKGTRNFTSWIHKALTIELLHRGLLDS